VTHNGSFHPDDVFAVATIKLFLSNNEVEILRTRDSNIIESGDFVVDVGGKYDGKKFFDHHQIGGAGIRENGVPFASFGLTWKHFGEKICGLREVADSVDKRFVQFVDLVDSGVGEIKPFFKNILPFTVTDVITVFNQERNFNEDDDRLVFLEALSFAERILVNEIKWVVKKTKDEKDIIDIYNRSSIKNILIFEKNYSWEDILKDFKEVLFVVEPEDDRVSNGNWKIKCVRDNPNSFVNRKDLPKEWSGLRDGKLAEISGVEGAIFCHNARFMAINRTKEGAVKMAQKALLG
jgi:uncharacterized UPF0160 family protein